MKDNKYIEFFNKVNEQNKLLRTTIGKLNVKNKKYIEFIENYYNIYGGLQRFWNENIPPNPLHILSKMKKCERCQIIFYAPSLKSKPTKYKKFYYCEDCIKIVKRKRGDTNDKK